MGEEKYYLYADLVHTGISASDLRTLNGKRVGLLAGSIHAACFYKWEADHKLYLQHVPITGIEDVRQKLSNGEIDCLVSAETPQLVQMGTSAIATVGGSGIHFVISKKRPDLKAELDTAMRRMDYDKPFYTDELYKRYLSAATSSALSGEEQHWLVQHGKIRIGWLDNDFGFSSIDSESGKLSGVITDYIKFAAGCLENQPLNFELVEFASQQEELQALKDNKIDMIFHFTQNPYVAEENGLILSNTVLSVNLAAVTANDYFVENANNTVAIAKDNLALKWYVSYNYPNWKVVEYASLEAVEQAVRSGEADCFIVEPGYLSKYIEDSRLHCVFLMQPGQMSFAVSRANTVLLSVLNKTLKAMPSSMLTGALSMYDNTSKKLTLMDLVKENILAVGLTITALFTVILIIILGFLRKSRIAEAKAKQAAQQSLELNKKLQESHKELQKALLREESANSAKTNFLFNMSHDIRTPMNALLGYAKLMKQELTDPKLLHYQEKMEQSGNLLLSIINNVLDMARIENGKIEVDENYHEVGDVLGGIRDVFTEEARKKGITLVYEAQVEHKHIMCDVTKIQEIFSNLVSNAIKYTHAGGKIILRTQELPSAKPGYVVIRSDVIDNGIGMSKEYLPTIFDSFSRERNTTLGKVAGTGLGMSIVKKLVDMMHGTITVESELGKGSKFSVTLEHKIADAAYYEKKPDVTTSSVQKELLKGKHILLAEDNDLNAEIATVILSNMGFVVERVEDGVQCVRQLVARPAGTYDVILMDIQMPNMDGYKATQAIRRFEDKQKASIPIIAMTANAFEEDRQNAFKAGMNGHIAKPIDVEKVEQTLISVLK